ncbi:MAG: hypothetical protein J0I09_14935 [Sphingobacteriia bacterium]|nr:hypothetical protein [Sphingobacteriia bacterium]
MKMKLRFIVSVTICFCLLKTNAQTVYNLGNTASDYDWFKLGTLSLGQQGYDAVIRISAGGGYNANFGQNGEGSIHFRTSNFVSNDGGFYAAGSFYNTGRTKIINGVRVIQINQSTWDFYANLPPYTGEAANLFLESAAGTWTKSFGHYGSTPPVSGIYKDLPEELVYQSQVYFNSNVGIGTTTPNSKLDVTNSGVSKDISSPFSGNLLLTANTGGRSSSSGGAELEFVIPANTDGTNLWGQGRIITIPGNGNTSNATGKMILGTRRYFNKGSGTAWNYGDDIVIDGNGNVGIGTTNTNDLTYKLFVEIGIRTRKIKVDQQTWPDYVFKPQYNLRTLSEVEQYIKIHQHLPDIPSEKEVKTKGVDVGETQAMLLRKIEELTLYVIELKKECLGQQKAIKTLKKQIDKK